MGYLYLAIALAAGLTKGALGRNISRDVESFKDCTFVNFLRFLFCAAVGAVMMFIKVGPAGFVFTAEAIPVYILAAVSMSAFCICWMFAYRNEAYMFLSIFTMLGTVVTCLLDLIVYGTPITLRQWIGIAILFAAVYIMSVYNKGIKGKLSAKGLLVLIIGSLGSALSDFAQKIYKNTVPSGGAESFNFYMYALGCLLLAVILPMTKAVKSQPKLNDILCDRRHILICFAIAFFLYLNSTTKTMAAVSIPSAQLYPVLQGANLIASAVMSHILFKEKINAKCICAMSTAFAGLLILHFA